MKPYLVAIAGPSGSGKSTLAARLAAAVPATIFGLDDYYHDLSHLTYEERCRLNFDDPGQVDSDELFRDLTVLAAGRAINRPVYDFSLHTRAPHRQRIEPNKFILVEGLWTLYWQQLRDLFGTKVYVEALDLVCYNRRRERDLRERGRTAESVDQQWNSTVQPMAELYVLPTRAFADIVISGTGPVEQSVQRVLDHIHSHRPAPKD